MRPLLLTARKCNRHDTVTAPTIEKSPSVSKVEDAESAIARFTEKTKLIEGRLAELEGRVGKLLKAEPAERQLLVCEHLSRKIKPLQDALARAFPNQT